MSISSRVSAFNRGRKWQHFLQASDLTPETTVLDVGFNEREFSPVDNYLEKHYPYPNRITALGLRQHRSSGQFRARYPSVRTVEYDGGCFPFADQEFDICWSNAVIEHVGNRDAQVLFLREIRRVSKRAFISTPNRYFPIEVHTRLPLLHWLPKHVFDRLLPKRKRWAGGDFMHLLSKEQLVQLLREAGIHNALIRSNYLGPWPLDFSVNW